MSDPEIGSRNWTALVRADTLQVDNAPLRWRTQSGQRPSDEWLRSQGFIGMIDPGPPQYDPRVERVTRLPDLAIDLNAGTATIVYAVIRLSDEELRSAINTERDRRIASGFVFNSVRFQTRPEDRENIAGAGVLALGAIVAGAQGNDYRWHGGEEDFGWIAENNAIVPMDAQTVHAFGQGAAAWKSAHIFAARALKEMSPIPADYADDKWWL